MARATIAPTNVPGGSYHVGFQEFSWVAANAANGNQFLSTGKERLLIRNVNADSPLVSRKVTLHHTRGTIEKTIPAGDFFATGQLPATGWKQTDNYIYVDGDHADIEFVVLVEP